MTGHWLQPALAGGALVMLAGSAWTQDVNITGLRTDPVMLYRDCQMDQGVASRSKSSRGRGRPGEIPPRHSISISSATG
jgi:hypothetical protein